MKYRCAKQRVLAITEIDGKIYLGENWIATPQKECPRKGLESGVGYELCKEICSQPGHAEIDLLREVDGNLQGNDVYIFGHYYVCEYCDTALNSSNVGKIIFPVDYCEDDKVIEQGIIANYMSKVKEAYKTRRKRFY